MTVTTRRVGEIILVSRDERGAPVLAFTPREWDAFLDGCKRGEFDHLRRPADEQNPPDLT